VDRSSADGNRRASAEAASRTVRAGLEAAAGRLPEGEPARIARLTVRLRPGAGAEEVAAAFARAMRGRGPSIDRDAP
jgi:hypothetical protein